MKEDKETTITCAVVQMNSSADRDANLRRAGELVAQAAAAGAELVALPENFARMRKSDREPIIGEPTEGPVQTWTRKTAAAEGVYLLAGSFPEAAPPRSKVYNTSLLVDPRGRIAAAYRKIHLFDVAVPDGETHRESERVLAGREAVTAETARGKMGLSICYDLRFPELYRRLAEQGALIIFAPSAFTERTGRAHWEILVRARAIENQVFMVAPAQEGGHPGGRRTYGHSLIVDPWGEVLAEIPQGEGIALARLDLERQAEIRQAMPCLEHRVGFSG
jgi:predicted amidohydrolase